MKLSSILHMNSFKTFVGTALSGLVLAAPPVFAQSYTTFDIGTLGGAELSVRPSMLLGK